MDAALQIYLFDPFLFQNQNFSQSKLVVPADQLGVKVCFWYFLYTIYKYLIESFRKITNKFNPHTYLSVKSLLIISLHYFSKQNKMLFKWNKFITQ